MNSKTLGGFVVAVALVAPAWGAEAPPPGPDKHRELAAMVDTYLLMQVQERVGLTDDQFARVMPLVRRLQQHRRAIMDGRRDKIRELAALLESGNATDASVQPLLDQLRATERSMCQKVIDDMQALDALLTPVQQAKYRVLEAEVERRIRRLRHRAGDRGPQLPAAGGEDPPE